MGENGDQPESFKENINSFIRALHPQEEKFLSGSLSQQCLIIERFKYVNLGTAYLIFTPKKWIPLSHTLVSHNEL